MRVGDAFLGDLDGPTDADWIRAELTAGATYELTLTTRDPDGAGPRAGASDTILEIYNTQRELIASMDDRPLVDGVLPPGGFHPQLSFTPADGGVHYFRVSSFIYPGGDNSGGYRLELAGPPSPEPDPEPDPAPVVADPDPDPTPAPDPDPEVVSPVTPDPVVIEPTPRLETRQGSDGRIEPLTEAELDAMTKPSVTTGGRTDGGSADEFIFDGVNDYDPATNHGLAHTYGTGNGGELLYGGGGNDVLVGGGGNDYLNGGPGNDYLYAGGLSVYESTALRGASLFDFSDGLAVNILEGGPGNDYLHNAGESDILDGGPGDDHLVADNGDQNVVAMIGGPGRDLFEVASGQGKVNILDFRNGEDKILLVKAPDPDSYPAGPTEFLDLYNLAIRAGVQWNMAWIATEVDNGVTLPLQNIGDGQELTIHGAALSDLQFEVSGGDLFIV